MHLLNNLQTEPYQAKSHKRSQTIDFGRRQEKNDTQQIPIQEHYRTFLLNNAFDTKRNPQTKKTKILDQSIKPIKYRQQQQQSIQQFDNISGEIHTQNKSKNNKTERSYIKDTPQLLSNEFYQRMQRKKMENKMENKLLNNLRDEQTAKQSAIQKSVKSYGSFLENMKVYASRSQSHSRKNNSVMTTQKVNQQQLKVQGNHKQLRQKCLKFNTKQIVYNKNSSKSIPVDDKHNKLLTINTKTIATKQVQKKEIQFTNKNNQSSPAKIGSIKSPHRQEATPKSSSRTHCGYKNFYSPFNGIQIRYITSENQDIFQKENASLNSKNQNYAITSFKKPFNRIAVKKNVVPRSIQKGIVFRYRQPSIKQIQQSIQGWKVQCSFDLNNDLCNEF